MPLIKSDTRVVDLKIQERTYSTPPVRSHTPSYQTNEFETRRGSIVSNSNENETPLGTSGVSLPQDKRKWASAMKVDVPNTLRISKTTEQDVPLVLGKDNLEQSQEPVDTPHAQVRHHDCRVLQLCANTKVDLWAESTIFRLR